MSDKPRRCDCTRTDSPEGEQFMPVSEHEAAMAEKTEGLMLDVNRAELDAIRFQDHLKPLRDAAREIVESWDDGYGTLEQADAVDALRAALNGGER